MTRQQSLFEIPGARQVVVPVSDFYNEMTLTISIEQVRQLPGKKLIVELTFLHQWCRLVAHARGNIARALLQYSRPNDEATIKCHLLAGTEPVTAPWLGMLALDIVYIDLRGITHRLIED